jgi:predicted DsbA family dithiol-disulfide isomerase
MTSLNIEIYSDLICPWCYIGRRRLEAGIKLLSASESPNILWRAFELKSQDAESGPGAEGVSLREVRELGAITVNGSRSGGNRQNTRTAIQL